MIKTIKKLYLTKGNVCGKIAYFISDDMNINHTDSIVATYLQIPLEQYVQKLRDYRAIQLSPFSNEYYFDNPNHAMWCINALLGIETPNKKSEIAEATINFTNKELLEELIRRYE